VADEFHDGDRIAAVMEASDRREASPGAGEVNLNLKDGIEKVLASIWTRVLGVRPIGRSDNFFDLGGSSLKAVLALAMINRELGQSLSVVHLFEFPTIQLLAAKLQGATAMPAESRGGSAADRAAARGRERRQKRSRQRNT
jgi:hypothetical protein